MDKFYRFLVKAEPTFEPETGEDMLDTVGPPPMAQIWTGRSINGPDHLGYCVH